jgi:hypothetical protein
LSQPGVRDPHGPARHDTADTVAPMCGRVVTSSTPEELAEYLGADEIVATLDGPDHNVPPTRPLPLVWEESGGPRVQQEARCSPLGARALLGRGPLRRQPDVQRPSRDGGLRSRPSDPPSDTADAWSPSTASTSGVRRLPVRPGRSSPGSSTVPTVTHSSSPASGRVGPKRTAGHCAPAL